MFERGVILPGDEDRRGRIDLYKRGCFVLEAKQSREGLGAKSLADLGVRPCPACCPTKPERHRDRGNGTY
jgi:hypothetical protein